MNRNNIWVHIGIALVMVTLAAVLGQIDRWRAGLRPATSETRDLVRPMAKPTVLNRTRAESEPEVFIKFKPGVTDPQIEQILLRNNDRVEDSIETVRGLLSIDDLDDAGDTFGRYEDDLIDLLDDTEKLTVLVNSSLSGMITYLTYSKSLIQQVEGILDPALEKSLRGMTDLLEKSLRNMDDIETLRNANSTVKNTIDEQFDKFEDENQFLNLDAEAELQSFTSDKNPPPASIQVILRTQEISLDSEDGIKDLETEKPDKGVLARLINVFIEIRDRITGLI